ncbi:MAG: transposase [Planctomycetota bacterium]
MLPRRKRPAHCVFPNPAGPAIVFLTVCAKDRRPWLASNDVHRTLKKAWAEAGAWRVGRYVIMPDHVHVFAGSADPTVELGRWVTFWKSRFTRAHGIAGHRWQNGYWDRRLRALEDYDSKWEYVRQNPVRHGIVNSADDWPFQGEMNILSWQTLGCEIL